MKYCWGTEITVKYIYKYGFKNGSFHIVYENNGGDNNDYLIKISII